MVLMGKAIDFFVVVGSAINMRLAQRPRFIQVNKVEGK